MSTIAQAVCPKCGATEIKNYSWLRRLGVLMFVLNAVTQLALATRWRPLFRDGNRMLARSG
jgi:hypothetical protein